MAKYEPHYCELCGTICVACSQLLDGCDACSLLHPEFISDPYDPEVVSDLSDM